MSVSKSEAVAAENDAFVPVTAEEAVNGRLELQKTADGNDPRKEYYFEADLDPNRRLPGGVYLDHKQRAEAEIARAAVEGREPDLENPPAYSGAPLRSAAFIDNPLNHQGALALQHLEPAAVIEDAAMEDAADRGILNPDPSKPGPVTEDEVVEDEDDSDDDTPTFDFTN